MNHSTPLILKMENHVHCISCVNQRCMAQSEPGVSCEIITCPLMCGAMFHSCKGDEHQLLCPLMKVPCLNSTYGCPAILIRSKIPAHMDVCPAGVVSCPERWNLHPTEILDLKPGRNLGSILDEIRNHKDLALALEDHQALLETIQEMGMENLIYKDSVIEEAILLALASPASEASTVSSSLQLQSAPKASTTEEVVSGMKGFNKRDIKQNCSSLSCLDESSAPENIGVLSKNATNGSLMETEANNIAKEPMTLKIISHTYPPICGQSFRRDQYPSHYLNIHCDFHPNFRDRIESHCPLALYGCRFSQQRLWPSTHRTRVIYHKHLKSFVIMPPINAEPAKDSQSDRFSGLPIEILWHIARFLDSFSLCQLSLVSRTMRQVCASLLPSRGIVELQWERGHFPGHPHTLRWRVKSKVWKFSPAFSPVYSWHFVDVPSMSDHMKKCPFFNRAELTTEPVPLTAMCTEQDRLSILHCYQTLRSLIA